MNEKKKWPGRLCATVEDDSPPAAALLAAENERLKKENAEILRELNETAGELNDARASLEYSAMRAFAAEMDRTIGPEATDACGFERVDLDLAKEVALRDQQIKALAQKNEHLRETRAGAYAENGRLEIALAEARAREATPEKVEAAAVAVARAFGGRNDTGMLNRAHRAIAQAFGLESEGEG